LALPAISLPNLETIVICLSRSHKNEVDSFDYLMKSFVSLMCENLQIACIFYVRNVPQILKYMIKNYANHFVCAPTISVLEHIPLKVSHLKLENLAPYRYAPHIEYLILHINDVNTPFERGWNNYKEVLSFFPNLKGVTFYNNKKHTSLSTSLGFLSSTSQTIWQQRIDFLKSQNIKILSAREYSKIISELRESLSPSWTFQFGGF
jgi:hypothetical protein